MPVNNIDNIENISEETIGFQTNDKLLFDVLLMEIRGKTVSYAMRIKREGTTIEKQLTEEIRLLENNVNTSTMSRLEEKKTQLWASTNRRVEGMIVTFRLEWLQTVKIASRYFSNLEKKCNYTSKLMYFIEKKNDKVFDQKEIKKKKKSKFVPSKGNY